MRTPSSALPAWPNGLLDGFGCPLPFDFAAAFFATCFAAFLAGFAAFFCFLAIACLPIFLPLIPAQAGIQRINSGSPLSRGRAGASFLLQLALRVEIAHAAA